MKEFYIKNTNTIVLSKSNKNDIIIGEFLIGIGNYFYTKQNTSEPIAIPLSPEIKSPIRKSKHILYE